MVPQETQGLLSPALRQIRLRKIAARIESGSTVLDLGCGAGYLAEHLPAGCRYFGVDRLTPPSVARFTDFLKLDLNEPGSADTVRNWINIQPRYLTCAAVMEHFDAPLELIRNFRELIASGGRLVATAAHPRGEWIHATLARVGLCSRDGAGEHHDFLDYRRIRELAAVSGGRLIEYELFLLRLNQLFVLQF